MVAGSNLLFQFWLATFFTELFHEKLVSKLISSFFIVCIPRKRKRKKAPSPSRYCPSTRPSTRTYTCNSSEPQRNVKRLLLRHATVRRPVHQHGHIPATPQSLNEIVAHGLSNNAREFLTLVLRVISLSEADTVPLLQLHDRRKLGEGHLVPWDHVRPLKQAADVIPLFGRSRSYGSPDGRAPQDFVYRSRRLSLKRNGLLVDVRFRMLDNVVFTSAASGNAMHERPGAVHGFWGLEGDPRSSTKGSGRDLSHRCLVVMGPLA